MYQSWMVRSSARSKPGPSTVYQKICPNALASGPSTGLTPAGSRSAAVFIRSSTRLRAQ